MQNFYKSLKATAIKLKISRRKKNENWIHNFSIRKELRTNISVCNRITSGDSVLRKATSLEYNSLLLSENILM
jgi:hypothetical protein